MSTAIRTTAVAVMPAKAETMTTAGTRGTTTAAIKIATAESQATAETIGTLWASTSSVMPAKVGMSAALGTPATGGLKYHLCNLIKFGHLIS
jgi:hypothetical protein